MEINLKKEQTLYLTSDTHYSHKNMCSGVSNWDDKENSCRNFETIEEMDTAVVDNINNVVGENDYLLHFGDWSFGGIENVWNFRKRIICKNIILILGNHDHHILRDTILPNCRWDLMDNVIIDEEPIKTYEDNRDEYFKVGAQELFVNVIHGGRMITVNKPNKKQVRFVGSHYPIASWEGLSKGVMHLHGHVHFKPDQKFGPGKMMDVGVDGHPEMKPYSFDEVISLLQDRPKISLYNGEYEDHHNHNER